MAVPHVFGTYTIKDEKGATSNMIINFPIDNDLGVIQTFLRGASNTAVLLDSIIRGQIVQIGMGLALALPGGIKTAPLAASDVEEGARFSFDTAAGSVTSFRVPTFDEAFIVAGTAQVDLADTDVDAFVDRITDGLTEGLTNVSPSDARGSDIVTINAARESFGKTRGS